MQVLSPSCKSCHKAPTSNAEDDGETGTDSDSGLSVEMNEQEDNSTDGDSEDELAEAAKKKKTSTELPAIAFPYRKDLLYGSDHQSKIHLIAPTSP
jgi:hypothetical protein